MDPKIDKWYRWLDTIKHEVQTVTLSRHMYREVVSILRANPTLPPSAFWEFLEIWHSQSAVMGIRRQLKNDQDSVSWIRLLTDISNNAHVLTRQWFCSLYEGSTVAHLADATFDIFAGPGGPIVRADLIHADIARLKTIGAKAEQYADRIVAHRDLRGVAELPTYTEVDAVVSLFEEFLKRYELMLRACDLMSALPEVHHDWQAVFRVPWDIRKDSA